MQTVRLIRAEKLRRILVGTFYLAAVFVLFYFLANAETTNEQMQYLFILILLPFGIFSEVLRYFYARANDTLHEACDPAACLKLLDRLKKIDFLHQFRVMGAYLRGFALIDLNRSREVPEMLEEQLGTNLTAKRKLDFEYNYLLFLTACAKGERRELEMRYGQIEKIFQMNRRANAGILSLEQMIKGIYLCQCRKYPEARAALDAVDAGLLTPREQAHYRHFCDMVRSNT